MKGLLKFLTGIVIALGPAVLVVWGLFFKLAPYIVSVIPSGQYHALFGVLVYIAIALLGGIEFVIGSFIVGFMLAGFLFAMSK